MLKTFIFLRTAIIALFFITNNSASIQSSTYAQAQQEIPSYDKWGMLAMKETYQNIPMRILLTTCMKEASLKGIQQLKSLSYS
jgi:hypothetical protein